MSGDRDRRRNDRRCEIDPPSVVSDIWRNAPAMTKAHDLFLIPPLALVLAIVATPFTAQAYDNHGVSPDLVAWEAFTEAVAPSNAPGVAGLEFETWASDDDLFGTAPPRWPNAGELPRRSDCKRNLDKEAAKAAGFPEDGCIEEEVRRNWATFRYFASHDLTS